MNEEREQQIKMLKTFIDKGDIYGAFRVSLALRPPPMELMEIFRWPQAENAIVPVRAVAERLLCPSARVSDSTHLVGSVAAEIRKALPEFQDRDFNAGEAAVRFLTARGDHRDRLQLVLPPGFAEGRPGAFIRATRGLIRLSSIGSAHTMYEHLQNSPDEQSFREMKDGARLSDVLDLTWMADGRLELRSVQEMVELLTSTVLPGTRIRFSPYQEPRYRSALLLHAGDVLAHAAYGGVLAGWSGRTNGADAAHVRIFLEPWATVQSGQVVEFDARTPFHVKSFRITCESDN
jgi:hypothetical protein